jgi:hypothetical protein
MGMVTRILAAAGAMLFVGSASLQAQIFTPLGNQSNLACANPPSGKNYVTVIKGDRYVKTSFKKARSGLAKKISAEREKIRAANELVKKLNAGKKRGLSSFDPSSKDFKAVNKFIFGKDRTEDLGELSPTIDEQIQMVEGTKAGFIANISVQEQLRQKITDCQKDKLPAAGELTLRYEALYKGPPSQYVDRFGITQPVAAPGIVVVYAVVPPGAVSSVFRRICKINQNPSGQGGGFPPVLLSHKLCLGLSDWPGVCDGLQKEVESGKGASKFELAFVDELRFDWHPDRKTNPCSFEGCAAQAEARLREKWGDSLPFIAGAATPEHCVSLRSKL